MGNEFDVDGYGGKTCILLALHAAWVLRKR